MSEGNRFSPPDAEVADLPSRAARVKPKQVRVAVVFLWVSFLLGLGALVLGAVRDPDSALGAFSLALTLPLLALNVLLIVRIDGGHAWARIVYAAFTVPAVALQFLPVAPTDAPGYVENALNLCGQLLDIAALALLFTRPGSRWFSPQKA
jgi:hypothetical protein